MTDARAHLILAAAVVWVVGCSRGQAAPDAEVTDLGAADTGDGAGSGDGGGADAAAADGVGDGSGGAPRRDPPRPARALTQLVDPMIGTAGAGNVIPGALVPHGLVRVSPVTNSGGGAIDAFEDGDRSWFGFAHMHLEGPGGSANGYGHLVLGPDPRPVGEIVVAPGQSRDAGAEHAEPGYYATTVGGGAVRAEVTATSRVGLHRVTRVTGTSPLRLVLDLGETRGRPRGSDTTISAGRVTGTARYQVHPTVRAALRDTYTGDLDVHFAIEFSDAPDEVLTWRRGDAATAPAAGTITGRERVVAFAFPAVLDAVEARVALSLIDVATAERSLAAARDTSFDEARAAAADAWNQKLNRVQIESEDPELVRVFYTALYHTMMQPADYTEFGSFRTAWAGEGEIFDAGGRSYYTDDWCLWDTYRTSVPLRTLIEPEVARDAAWSLLHAARQGGWLPKCPWAAAGDSRVMTGNPQIPVLAITAVTDPDAFDLGEAVSAATKTATLDENPYPSGLCGYFGLGTPPEYGAAGFVSRDCDPTQGASMTLEYAYADWALARLARAAADDAVAARFDARSASWRNHWDVTTGFMRGRNRDGSWVEPFDPDATIDTNDFVEASAWIFSFFVPHDIPGLIEVHGGEEAFVARLDAFFDGGRFDPTNQPSFHIPYLYAWAGRPELTRARVADTVRRAYTTRRDGLPGNDDAGSTSAWLVLSALGLYPVAPGDGAYTWSAPMFRHIALDVSRPGEPAGARWLDVSVEGDPYAAGAEVALYVDDVRHAGVTIGHDALMNARALRFVTSP